MFTLPTAARRTLLASLLLASLPLAACGISSNPPTGSGTNMSQSGSVATSSFSSGIVYDLSSASSSAMSSTIVVTQSPSRTRLAAGQDITIALRVRNNGSTDATSLQVEDAFPPSKLTIVDAGGGIQTNDHIVWFISRLGAGQSKTLSLRARGDGSVTVGDIIINVVTVRGATLQSPLISTQTIDGTVAQQPMPNTGPSGYTDPQNDQEQYVTPLN